MANWDDVKKKVETNGNVLTLSMTDLKDAAGKDKLGVNVRAEISKTLAGMGLGHIPQELPSYQHESVRIYKKGTPVGDFIDTVMSPGESNDKKLKEKFPESAVDYTSIIDKIRELVSE